MIVNALTGEPRSRPPTLEQQEGEFTAEGSPPPGHTSGTDTPSEDQPSRTPGAAEPGAQRDSAATPATRRGA
jgi:hypothetical protein